eukprot:CAMPEP_0178684568 /NCGR_PEP_ID=MMETSP0699-20121125/2911_1 /TAXON_ID=265572 /ORGANISM="Extubocellulus spinifer, Strain CCMP396" /LENGTH=31 /DNA_ID= /DNA_START= /DNA_END= /DNA_ORIENTATION=
MSVEEQQHLICRWRYDTRDAWYGVLRVRDGW